MIEFVNITKKFRNNFWEKEFLALNDISFRINEGDLVGFLGANGAGKTTLIKCLMDFSRQDSGEITFSETMGKAQSEIKSNIGYLPEKTYLYQHLTGREFLTYTGTLSRVGKGDLQKLISDWSVKIQIDHALDRVIRTYSKGMQQRLGFISALIHNPKFLVLDEPLSGLDPIGRRDFKKILKELNTQGTTIFFSSHIVSDVEEGCNQVVFLERGKLIYTGSINDLIAKDSGSDFTIHFLDDGELRSERCSEENKDLVLTRLLEKKANIISLEKDKATLEEIIYKIKR